MARPRPPRAAPTTAIPKNVTPIMRSRPRTPRTPSVSRRPGPASHPEAAAKPQGRQDPDLGTANDYKSLLIRKCVKKNPEASPHRPGQAHPRARRNSSSTWRSSRFLPLFDAGGLAPEIGLPPAPRPWGMIPPDSPRPGRRIAAFRGIIDARAADGAGSGEVGNEAGSG
jgi:hypothetical protein